MFRGITVAVECDGCGQVFHIDTTVGGFSAGPEWTVFDLAMDMTRWRGTGHACADGRWFCDACDAAASGHPGGEDPDEEAGPEVAPGTVPNDLETTRELAAAAGRHAEDLRNLLREANEALDTVVGWAALTREYWDADADTKVGKRLIALSGSLAGYAPEIDAVHAFRMRLKDALAGFIPYAVPGPEDKSP